MACAGGVDTYPTSETHESSQQSPLLATVRGKNPKGLYGIIGLETSSLKHSAAANVIEKLLKPHGHQNLGREHQLRTS